MMFGVAAVIGYFALRTDTGEINQGPNTEIATYRNSNFGIEFKYRSSPNGYVLQESTPTDTAAGLVRALVLVKAEDVARGMPVGGEGPATMSVHVFSNSENQQPRPWADAHMQYSNINLTVGDVAKAVVGGVDAIRYMADGLYRSDNVVVVHGEYAYVLSGAFLDEDSDLRRDFQPLLDSIRFISQAEHN